ncbi:recombinase family protein [Anaerosporobacter sp.]
MARPSNRGTEKTSNQNTKNSYSTATYIRLSYESYYTDSESIENQKLLLRDYLKQHREMVLCEEFIDDGKTGTDFERPAFERMMKAVREGAINCIVVKDLSRFGRNHVEVGDYLERIFPLLGIRFISVNDGYDSFAKTCDKEQLLLSVKNLMHEMYARDVSKKICSSIKIKQKTRKFYRSAIIPYGYKMGLTEYEIDEQTAAVVRRIFQIFVSGESMYQICSTLNREGIASPREYSKNKLLYTKSNEDACWFTSTVQRILKNEIYVGTMVRHKTEQELYNDKKTEAVEEEDWIRVENTHPAIIDKIIFEKVRRKLNKGSTKRGKQ